MEYEPTLVLATLVAAWEFFESATEVAGTVRLNNFNTFGFDKMNQWRFVTFEFFYPY